MRKVLVTGSTGFLGRHLVRALKNTRHKIYQLPSSQICDLRKLQTVEQVLDHIKPDVVYHLAAHVGGIQYNLDHPATLFYDNILMNSHMIQMAANVGVQKFIFVSSVCAYPKFPSLPTPEHQLWDGKPEDSNLTYGLSKRVALAQLEGCAMEYGMQYAYPILANLYGPGDDFGPNSHVIPALIKKLSEAKDSVTLWGTGSQSRDFLYVLDAVDALICFLNQDAPTPINIAGGDQIFIKTLVDIISKLVGYHGEVKWDHEAPQGQRNRHYSINKARDIMKWHPQVDIETGLKETVEWYKQQ